MLHKCRHWFNFYVQFYFLLGINVQELNFVSLLIIQVVVGTRIRLSSNSGGRYTEGHLIEKMMVGPQSGRCGHVVENAGLTVFRY